jgi:RNA polymerase sigma-70 factor (ECF subfamily)
MSSSKSLNLAVDIPRRAAAPAISTSEKRLAESSAALDEIESEVICLYKRTAPALFRYAVSLVKDAELSRDALQETFLRYHAARVNGLTIHAGKAWLFKVLRNYLLDYMKVNLERAVVPIEEAKQIPAQSRDPEAACEHAEIRAMFGRVLAPRELECLQLRAQGLRYREIANILRVEAGTVGAMLARALRKLREAAGIRGAIP